MLMYGYRPAVERRQQFDDLTRAAAASDGALDDAHPDDLTAANAKEFLIKWGEREFSPWAILADQRLPVAEELTQVSDQTRLVSRPTQILHAQGAFVVEKKVYLRTRLEDVKHLVNPENWEHLGEFFARTFKENQPNSVGGSGAEPWHGVLREDFIVSWNGFTTNVFKQRLKVDYSVTPQIARTDYALMYEEDDQIALNEGFLEVKDAREDKLPDGWISGTMRKKLKFTSSMLNLLSPALLSMILDSKAGGFNNFLDEPRAA
jgi:hypothetical protein